MQQKLPRVLHPRVIFVADVWLDYFSVARWIGSVPTRATTLIVVIRAISRCTGCCGSCRRTIICAAINAAIDTGNASWCERPPNSRVRSIN